MPPRRRNPLDDQVLGVYHAPPDPRFAPPCANPDEPCGHGIALHAFGVHKGRNIRKACSASDCWCRLYVPQERTEDEGTS